MRRGERRAVPRPKARGFTFVWMLAALALASLGLAVAAPLWSEQLRREREEDLLRAGRLYAEAIREYVLQSPGAARQYPPDLDSLLYDARFVGVRRHLRKLYPDPVNPGQPWGLVLGEDGRVHGVRSLSEAAPLRRGLVDLGVLALPAAGRYADWQFVPDIPL